jgi:hypothetical protein
MQGWRLLREERIHKGTASQDTVDEAACEPGQERAAGQARPRNW